MVAVEGLMALGVILILLLFCSCFCKSYHLKLQRRRNQSAPPSRNTNPPGRRPQRQKNARRKWRRRRERRDSAQHPIVSNEATPPVATIPFPNPNSMQPQASNPQLQHVVSFPPPVSFPQFQPQYPVQQYLYPAQQHAPPPQFQTQQFPPPSQNSAQPPHNMPYYPVAPAYDGPHDYLNAEPNMNFFPEPPPPYETQECRPPRKEK